jgi:hypothetical protein
MESVLVEEIFSTFGVKLLVDLFASDKWHVTDDFVSQIYTLGCKATQALLQDWGSLVPKGEFAWLFSPIRVIAEVVQMVERFRTNCDLVVPKQKASNWWISLFTFGTEKNVREFAIPRGTQSCEASRRVLGLFNLRAYKIQW